MGNYNNAIDNEVERIFKQVKWKDKNRYFLMHDIPVVNSHVHICKYFCISHLHKYTTKFTTVYSFVKIIITICGMRPNFSQARNAPVTSFIHSPPQLLASAERTMEDKRAGSLHVKMRLPFLLPAPLSKKG